MQDLDAVVLSALAQAVEGIVIDGCLGDVLLEKPKNGWSPRCDNSPTGTPVLTLSAVTGFQYRGDKFKTTSEPVSLQTDYWLHEGDLLITRSNTAELVGHAAIYNGSPSPCIYSDLMMRLKVDEKKADKQFAHLWLMSDPVREHIRDSATGTSPSMKKIAQGTVTTIPFPIRLSLTEQRHIVDYFRGIQKQTDTLEKTQAESAIELDALLPSLLTRAFRGEL